MGRRPPRYAVLLAGAALSTGLLLTGCGGDPKPSPPPTEEGTVAAGNPTTPGPTSPADPPTSADPTSTSTATKSHTTSEGGDSGAAAGHTKKGAEAFVRHYIEVINQTGLKPEAGRLEPLGSKKCKSCTNYEENVLYLKSHRLHNSGPAAKIKRIVAQFSPKGPTATWALVDQLPIRVVKKNGEVVNRIPSRKGSALVFTLSWRQGRWLVDDIEVDETGVLPS